MIMNCENCGDAIFVGDEYYHDTEMDINVHLSCVSSFQDETKLEKRYRED